MTTLQVRRTGPVTIGEIALDSVTEAEVISRVRQGWAAGQGGTIVTVNADVARAVRRQPELAELVAAGSLVVADGMPLLWAARASGTPLPERVTGSSLIYTLTAAAAADGRSIYLLGGAAGVPEGARRDHAGAASGAARGRDRLAAVRV